MMPLRALCAALLLLVGLVTSKPIQARQLGTVAAPGGVIALPVASLRRSVAQGAPVSTLSTGYHHFVNITIGSDEQVVPVLLDTQSSITFVNPDCRYASFDWGKKRCNALPQYQISTSTTAKQLLEAEDAHWQQLGSIYGSYFTDDIQLGSASAKDVKFVVPMVTEHIEIGVLGLGDKHDHQVNGSYDTFMETLVNQGQIQSYSMSLNLRSADQTGSIILGGIDTKKYKCDLVKLKTTGRTGQLKNWNTAFLTGVTQSFSQELKTDYPRETWDYYGPLYSPKGMPVTFNPSAPGIYIGQVLFEAIGHDYPGAELTQDAAKNPIWKVSCNAPGGGSLDFTFSDIDPTLSGKATYRATYKTIQVPYSDLIIQPHNDGECFLAVTNGTPDTQSQELQNPTLGAPFLKAAYVVLNHDDYQNYWIGEATNCGENLLPIGNGEDGMPDVKGCGCEEEPEPAPTPTPESTSTSSIGYAAPPTRTY